MPRSSATTLLLLLALGGCGDDGPGVTGTGTGGSIVGTGGAGGGTAGGGGRAGTGGGGSGGTGGALPDGIVVDTPPDRAAGGGLDGYCDLLEAIEAAATGQSVRECANTSGSARIILAAGVNYPTIRPLRFATQRPDKPFEIVAAGAGGARATISAAAGWVPDAGDPATGCLVHISGGADVTITNITLSQASALTLSGACVTRGALDVRRGRVTGFRRAGLVATCLPASGCDHETNGDHATTLRVIRSLVDGNTNPRPGGGIASEGSGATVGVYNSAIVNNTSDGGGGGVYFGGGWSTDVIQASTVSGNHASEGGGVLVRFFCANTYLHVYNSTIADNTAVNTGGGIQFEPADINCATQDVSVFASVVAGNHALGTFEHNINSSWSPLPNHGLFNCHAGSLIWVAPGLPVPVEIDGPCLFDERDARLGPLTPMGGEGNLPAHPLYAGSAAIDRATNDLAAAQQRDAWVPFVDRGTPPAWTLFDRVVDGDGDGAAARDLGAVEMSGRWQAELLAVAGKGPSPHAVITEPAGLDRGAGTTYAAAGASNEFVTYAVPITEPGDHDLMIGLWKTPDAGRFQLAIASRAEGPWTMVGPVQDGYAATPGFGALGPFALPKIAAGGERLVRLTITGKEATSAGHRLSLDYLETRRSTTACPVARIAAGYSHTCALLMNGGVRCWGANEAAQLGDGGTDPLARVPALDVLTGAAAITAGAKHTCAVTTAGGVRCWGWNDRGQLGDGTLIDRATPPATDALTGVKEIAAGFHHTCALTTTGGVRCWGSNNHGQLGDGTRVDRATPPAADVLTGVKAIGAAGDDTCALMTAGGVRCWGDNLWGQLGDGTMVDRATPPATDVIAGVSVLAVGSTHVCVVTNAGGARCWGHNGNGEIGDGTYDEWPTPPATDALAGVQGIAAAPNFTCALTAAGGVRCWGYNEAGQIGDDTELAVDRKAPAATDILGGAQAIAVGFQHACALMVSGGVRCWGGNTFGQLGDGLAPDLAYFPPTLDVTGFTGTCR